MGTPKTRGNSGFTLCALAALAMFCTGCLGLTSATSKNGSQSAPVVSITSPVSGATVSGIVQVLASVSASTTTVQFKVDGKNTGAALSSAPFSYSLNTTTLANGIHTLSAVAGNSAGLTTTSSGVSITTSNPAAVPPTISIISPISGAIVSGTINVLTNVSANTTSVQFKLDGNNIGTPVTGAPFSFSLNTATLSSGNHALAAVASNAAGQASTSATVTITLSNMDTTPPAISIVSPSSGANVSGVVLVSAIASDNVGVAKVEFYLDSSLQSTVASSPYTWNWSTAAAASGSHILMVKAFDAAGNSASASVTVSVTQGGGGGLTPSGPITISGQSNLVIQNLHITNPNGDCLTITNSTAITLKQSEIGPCKGNGVVISGGSAISVFDNYIHPEGTLANCCDITDGIFANGSQDLTIQGNVIAYGESNIEANNQTNLKVIGNFLLNPRGGANSRGQNVQVWANSTATLVQNNYALSSADTTVYKFAEAQEDSINFGASSGGPFTNGVVARDNYVTGGRSNSGCGIIADTGANSVQFLSNVIVNSGQCGIGIADGTNQIVDGNKILNATPVSGGGNTAIYVWKATSSDPACGPVQISNNVASGVDSSGAANSYWDGGGCGTVTLANNTFDASAQQLLSPQASKLPPPQIPPLPANCVIASPFSNNTAFPPCGGSGVGGVPPTVAIASPASGATVSGTISVTTSVSANTVSVQLLVDGSNVGTAVTSAPFGFSLGTVALSNGNHLLTAIAANAAAQTATSAAVVISVNNPRLAISTTSLASGQLQAGYTASLQAAGGTPPYAWSVSTGALPTGLTLSFTTGIISGTPSAAGSFPFTLQVSDSVGATASAGFSINITTAQPPPVAPFGHVYLVAMENTNYTDVVGTSAMPYLNGLANQYGLATQYYADTHPSIGNYLMWVTGQILTNDDNQTPASFPVSVDNAVREVLAAGKTWKQYAESIPSVGYTGGDTVGPDGGNFSTHHAPLLYLTDVLDSPAQLLNIVPFTQFATDLANNATPNYSFITPNMCDDGHDCSLTIADNWLQKNIDPLIKSAAFQTDGLLVIAFDESGNDNTNGGGRVVAVVISPLAKGGYQSLTLYKHESVLRLMLEGLGIRTLPGAAATAPKMWEFFTFAPPT